jgi:hypothetical protein
MDLDPQQNVMDPQHSSEVRYLCFSPFLPIATVQLYDSPLSASTFIMWRQKDDWVMAS